MIILIANFNVFILFGQSGDISNLLVSQLPVSPNTAELGKYGQIPVGLFTGTLQTSIPLYNIESGSLSLPISLSYSSNGVNVDKYSSTVGMDWVFNAGGMISRIMYGKPDECRVEFPEPPYFPGTTSNMILRTILNSDCADTQPDVFIFNVGGYTGKFYWDENMEIKKIEPSLVEIAELNPSHNDIGARFLISTPEGNKYWFGGENAEEESASFNLGNGDTPPNYNGITAWYLKKIQSPEGKEITFNYLSSSYLRYAGMSQNVTATRSNEGIYGCNNSINSTWVRSGGTESYLTSIVWDNGTLEINYDDNNKVETISVKDGNFNTINKFGFSYYISDSNGNYPNGIFTNYLSGNKRYFLKELNIINPINEADFSAYEFDYYDIEGLPERFTFSRDYWGYYNGKNNTDLLPNNLSNFNSGDYFSSASELFQYPLGYLFRNVGGDKEADPEFAIKGLLKKITYPTSGYNEFFYEPQSIYKPRTVYPRQQSSINLNLNLTYEPSEDQTDDFLVAVQDDDYNGSDPHSSQELKVYIHGSTSFNSYDCEDTDNAGYHHIAHVSIYNLDTNEYETLYGDSQSITPISYGTSKSISNGENLEGVYFLLPLSGGIYNYRIKLRAQFPCTSTYAYISFNAPNGEPYFEPYNKPLGGMRIKSVISNDNNGNIYTEDYKYGDFDCIECSSGIAQHIKPAISFTQFETTSGYYSEITRNCTLGSGTLNNLYFAQSYHIAYPVVIKIFKNGLEQGAIRSIFDISTDEPPILVENDWISGTPYTNYFGTGNLLKEQTYNAQNEKIMESINNYEFDMGFSNSIPGFNISLSQSTEMTQSNQPSHYNYNYNINKYYLNTRRQYLAFTTKTQYFDSGNITTTTYNTYEGANPLQLSSQTTTSSTGEVLEQKFYYPQDLLSEPFMPDLVDENRIGTPIKTETYRGTMGNMEKLSETHTKYKDFDPSTEKQILPSEQHSKKGISNIDITTTTDRKITYDKYDDKGNILQYTLENGTAVSIIWGYNGQYPLAKIEGATYSQIQSAVINLQTLSANDDDSCTGLSGCEEANLRNALNQFRINNPSYLISTYTYDPLIGVTSIMASDGTVQYYQYDGLGRLKQVKDQDGNVLKEMEYHYQEVTN